MNKYFCMAIALNGTKPETTDTIDRDVIATDKAEALRQFAEAIAQGKTPLETEHKDTIVLVAMEQATVTRIIRLLQN